MKNNILLVNCVYPPLGGGAGIVVRNSAIELQKSGFNVNVFTGGREKKEIKIDDVPIYSVPSFQFAKPNNISDYNNPEFEKYFLDILNKNKICVVHFHAIQGLGANLVKLSLDMGIKTIITMHDLWWICPFLFTNDELHRPTVLKNHYLFCSEVISKDYLKKRASYLNSILSNKLLKILTVSKTMKDIIEYAIPVLKGRVIIIRNSVPKKCSKTISSKKTGQYTFSYFGKLNPSKGFHLLIQAGLILAKIRSDFQVNMYGMNDMGLFRFNPLTKYKCPWLNLYNCVPEKMIDNAIAESNCVVIPSIVPESFSLIAHESLQMNKDIISSGVGALGEIDNPLHHLYLSYSPVDLALEMNTMIENNQNNSLVKNATNKDYYNNQLSDLKNLYAK